MTNGDANPYRAGAGAGAEPLAPGGIPRGVVQILEATKDYMPLIEEITGLNRRDIALQLLKSASKGKIDGFIGGLVGMGSGVSEKPTRKEALIQTLSVRIPVLVFLGGLAVLGLFFIYRLIVIFT